MTCAVVTTALVARNQLFTASAPNQVLESDPVAVTGWAEYLKAGHRIGPVGAKFVLLEFADFECPACREFAQKTLHELRDKYPQEIAVIFRHWPLPYHKFAIAAAIASECAASQNKFVEFHDVVYRFQDSLGLKPLVEYAAAAGVADTAEFKRCALSPQARNTVEADLKAARQFGGSGTPTIGAGGVRYIGVPSLAELERAMRVTFSK
ncbi:MAG: thioredoxin domain-containing protein [Gemmatimonadota bacterium]